jgi:Protein of unknown function (DUF3237)
MALRPDVRLPFITDDGETVLLHYTGLVEQTDKFKRPATADQSTDWSDQYMRLAMNFDTGALRYRWLDTSLFIARDVCSGREASNTNVTG